MATNKIVTHFCGGFAINASVNIFSKLDDLGDGFADIVYNYIDTSDRNIALVKNPKGPFWLVQKDTNSGTEITGSGGERRHNAAAIKANISEYLDEIKCKGPKHDEFHLIVCSGSGGSGSVIAPVLLMALLDKNIPTAIMMVGDSKDGMSALNTLNTLASFNQIATKRGKTVGLMYVNNSEIDVKEYKAREIEADKYLQSQLTTFALFLSGNNLDLDNQDIRAALDQSNYQSLTISPGLYGLHFYMKSIPTKEGCAPTVVRTLTDSNTDFTLNVNVLHHKVGYITDTTALDIFKSQLPLHMVMVNNAFLEEEEFLKRISDNADNIAQNIKSNIIKGSKNSIKSDDDLIL